ncbi:hypothetical protein G6O69_18615 [Pseudenhygromyxa sp. WMMC2535]|uniref:LodA/GoxA family CTQ-dependent oxidase n=1 Tax=Pseudenhygromyxa sp. WMMC2535 TaxID=2712867 RepID=UPI0015516FF5|nr:LodA/GoxA family CTQ-dependent oxidase [Pseudenhygromyxa sp. WMMC2535]NVB39863.1 hypothetical protein [Pseudenhygromyxa sp. WMMC2535]
METPRYRIYPSIGVARLGNGRADKVDAIFSPEIPWANLFDPGAQYLNEEGAIRKQAQRFYIYECDERGFPKSKLNAETYKIEWTVEVANKKPFWYDFNNCLDLSATLENHNNLSASFFERKLAPGIGASYRNPNILSAAQTSDNYNYRRELVNNPDAVSVSEDAPQSPIEGCFPKPQSKEVSQIARAMDLEPKNVKLGTVEYDEGSLIFYAGDGVSAALNPSDLNTDFADNSNWYDDICDGRVTATIRHRGTGEVVAELNCAQTAAWVTSAPPDYAPQIQPLATMYDLICGAGKTVYETDFSLVFPIFLRLYRMQWVNLGDFLAPSFREVIDELIASGEFSKLYDPSPGARGVREAVFSLFRNPSYPNDNEPIIPSKEKTSIGNPGTGTQELKLPYYPGDGVNYPGSPAQWFAIPPLLYRQLEAWRDGDFPPLAGKYSDIDALARHYQQQFAAAAEDPGKAALLMTRAVLETLYGGGFHPGVELTWPMRHEQMYAVNQQVVDDVAPGSSLMGLREIRVNAASEEEQAQIYYNDFGLQITSQNVTDSLKPGSACAWLWKSTPGDLTKWMGIPWQSDAGSCQAVFTDSEYPVPAWWAANLPVDVLTEESLVKIQDVSVLDSTRRNIYASRLPWLKTTDTGFVGYHAEGGYLNGLINMVYQWRDIGMIAGRPSGVEVDGIPKLVYVSSGSENRKDRLAVFLGAAYPNEPAPPDSPTVFYQNSRDTIWIPKDRKIWLSSRPDGTGDTRVDDVVRIWARGGQVFEHDYSHGCSGQVVPLAPRDITDAFAEVAGNYVTLKIEYSDKCGGSIGASEIYLCFQ